MCIRDRRLGEEYAVVSADGSLPLPPAALEDLAPGTLVRVHPVNGWWTILPADVDVEESGEAPYRGRHE